MTKMLLNRMALLITGRWVDYSIIFFAALAWGATLLLLSRGGVQMTGNAQRIVFGVGLMSLVLAAWFTRGWSHYVLDKWRHHPGQNTLGFVLLLGLALRVAWVIWLPAMPSSDGATYLALATKLLNGADYEMADTRAYWPPGYPLFLMAWLLALPSALVVPASQAALFIVGALGVYRVTQLIVSDAAALIATLLFALWPNLIALSATPEKEALILALLPWVMFLVLRASLTAGFWAGVGLGAAVLVQPSLQLLIPAIVLWLLIQKGLKSIPCVLLLVAGSLLVVGPWSYRNLQVLGEFKLVATNGGDVLYRANNPLATGGYTSRGEVDFSDLSELDVDKKGQELALRWIRENPLNFAALVVEKQLRFMGDDAVGVYATFRSDGDQRDSRAYIPLKLLANAWWLIVWLLMAQFIVKGGGLSGDVRVLMWGWLYLFLLHSVFESAGKYHVPMIWVLCVVMGSLCASAHASLQRVASP